MPKIFKIIFLIFVGVVFGYYWRMIQTEKIYQHALVAYAERLTEIQKNIFSLDLRLRTIEDKLKLKAAPAPSVPRPIPEIQG